MALRLQHFTCNHPTAHALSQPPTIPEPCHMRSALAAQPGFRRCSALVPSFMQSLRHFHTRVKTALAPSGKIIRLPIKVCRWARGLQVSPSTIYISSLYSKIIQNLSELAGLCCVNQPPPGRPSKKRTLCWRCPSLIGSGCIVPCKDRSTKSERK